MPESEPDWHEVALYTLRYKCKGILITKRTIYAYDKGGEVLDCMLHQYAPTSEKLVDWWLKYLGVKPSKRKKGS